MTINDRGLELRAAIADAVRSVSGLRVEHAVLLDQDGTELWRGVGSARRVGVESFPALGAILVHNHPGGGSLSAADLHFAYQHGLLAIIAVGPTEVHEAWRPARGWPLVTALPFRDNAQPSELFYARVGIPYRVTPNVQSQARFICFPGGEVSEAW